MESNQAQPGAFKLTKEDRPVKAEVEYFYDKDDLDGRFDGQILSWPDFMARNPSRSILDVGRWDALRKDHFGDGDKNVPYHVAAARQNEQAPSQSTQAYHETGVMATTYERNQN